MEIVAISALNDNYIWALADGRSCVVVDPGEAAPVEAFLATHALSLQGILITHAHGDHTAGAAALAAAHSCTVAGPALPMVTQPVTEGGVLHFPGFAYAITTLATPGHTPEHLSYLAGNALFCGDTLFAAGCGRLLGGSAAQLFASLSRLAALAPDTRVCAAHEYTAANLAFARAVEPENAAIAARQQEVAARRARGEPSLPSRLSDELLTNPFLRCGEADVQKAVSAQAEKALATPLAVFTALRAWKDDFRAPR